MDELAAFAALGKWGLPAALVVALFREWLSHRRHMRALELQEQLQEAMRKAHDALPKQPGMFVLDDEVWPAVEEARSVLSKSLPPQGRDGKP